MKTWPKHPVIYEINTRVWLGDLSRNYRRVLDFATVPPQEWDQIASGGFDAVWFMGVWERSPAGIGISMQNQGLLEEFRRALPDFAAEDNVGSPYCVRRYVVDEHLGGPKALAAARPSRPIRTSRPSMDACCKRPIMMSFAAVKGVSASGLAGPTTRAARGLSPGAGLRILSTSSSS